MQGRDAAKKVYVFLFTNWAGKGSPGHGKEMSEWAPFEPNDSITIGAITLNINEQVARILPRDFPVEERIYLEHSKCGIDVIGNDGEPSWQNAWGAIVDQAASISPAQNVQKLERMLAGLARQPKERARQPAAIFMISQSPSSVPGPLLKFSLFIQEFNIEKSSDLIGMIVGQLVSLAQLAYIAEVVPSIPPQLPPLLEKGF